MTTVIIVIALFFSTSLGTAAEPTAPATEEGTTSGVVIEDTITGV